MDTSSPALPDRRSYVRFRDTGIRRGPCFSSRPLLKTQDVRVMETEDRCEKYAPDKHGNGAEKPQQQGEGEVERPKTSRQVLSSSDERGLDVLRLVLSDIRCSCGEAHLHKLPGGLKEA